MRRVTGYWRRPSAQLLVAAGPFWICVYFLIRILRDDRSPVDPVAYWGGYVLAMVAAGAFSYWWESRRP